MKNLKTFELFDVDSIPNYNSIHKRKEDYIEELYDKIENINYTINGFQFYKINNFSNKDDEYEWYNDNYNVIAKPYIDEPDILLIHINNPANIKIETIEKELPIPTSTKKVNSTFEKYIEIIKEITDYLNKRDDMVDKLSKLSNNISIIDIPIEMKHRNFKSIKIEYDKINGISFRKIKTPKIIEIFNKINKKYPERFTSIKYNI